VQRRLKGGERWDVFSTRALLDARATIHIGWRLCHRANLLVNPSGPATAGAGIWHWALPVFVILDLIVWQVLRRSDRFGLGWRLVMDSIDVAFWSLSPLPPSGLYEGALLTAVPLATEGGIRLGPRALAIPAALMAVVVPVRLVAGLPVLPFTFLWLVLGVWVGVVGETYCRRLYREAEEERAERRAAEVRRAFVAGQNAVAMGASSVVDSIEGVVPALGRPPAGSALSRLASGWKAELGETTKAQAVYLQVALMEWERRYNLHPDLQSRVELSLDEGAGTTLVTSFQADWIADYLDRSGLRGCVRARVEAPHGASRLPGAPLVIHFGPQVVTVPADPAARSRVVDPGPATFLFIAAQCLTLNSQGGGFPPLAVVVALAGLCVLGSWVAHRLLVRRGRGGRPAVLGVAVVVCVAITVVGSLSATAAWTDDGLPVYVNTGMLLLAYLGGFYWYRLGPAGLGLLLAGFAGSGAAALFLSPGPAQLRPFAAVMLSFVGVFPACRRMSTLLAEATERYERQSRSDDRVAIEEAFGDGRRSVADLVREARDDAHRQLDQVRHELDGRLAEHVETRLEEVDLRLRSLDQEPDFVALSSSTTTS
jgi:hypothetical protein